MIGSKERWQEDLFLAGPLSSIIPNDHILKRVDRVLNLAWLRTEIEELYNKTEGRPSIDPEAALRLMLAGFFHGIVHDRKLMREAQVNLAIRWFAGYRLHEKLPDHSSLTRIRQRWGLAKFKEIFQKVVKMCIEAGLVDGETVHIDATLIRADVSWESLSEKHIEKVFKENEEEDKVNEDKSYSKAGIVKKQSKTDPEASLATGNKSYRMEPSYKQHTVVDDRRGIIVDVVTTTGEASEGKEIINQIERVEEQTGKKVSIVTADAGYGHAKNYAKLEERGIQAIIPPAKERISKSIPIRRFKYDSRHQIIKCPGGKILKQQKSRKESGWVYSASRKDCRICHLKERCISDKAQNRTIIIVEGYEALLRARRKRQKWDERIFRLYNRHRWQVEGRHGEAKIQHGLARAVRRGLENVSIQVFLTAAVMNLKRLAASFLLFLSYYQKSLVIKLKFNKLKCIFGIA
jgi:transposase